MSRLCRLAALTALFAVALAAPGFASTTATPFLHHAMQPPATGLGAGCQEADGRWAERTASAGVGANGDAGADFNADGVNDVWVAQPLCDLTVSNQGRVYLLSGKEFRTDQTLVIRTIDSPVPQADAKFGFFISVIGDVNADGKDDIAIGTDSQDVGTNVNQGKAWVFSGNTGALLYALDNPNPQADGRFGSRIGRAGNVNGGGSLAAPDIIVGASNNDVAGRANQGQAYIFDGRTGRLIRPLNMPTGDEIAGGNFGLAVQGPGDVNGDGTEDQLVAATNFFGGLARQGRMYVFSGFNGTLIRRIDDPTPQANAIFGFQDVAPLSPGDLNGDGKAEVYGNGFLQDGPLADQGAAWVFDGATGAVIRTLNDPAPTVGGQFGWSMSKTDYNDQSDTTNDLYVGQAPHVAGTTDQNGGTYVFDGTNGALFKALELPTACQQALTATDPNGPRLGWTSSAPGDLNNDGDADYIAGAPFFNRGTNGDEGVLLAFMSNETPNPAKPC